jgi:hypothetical protein
MTLIDAMDDPNLFAPWFKNPKKWESWRAFIKSLFAIPLSAHEQSIFRDCTQRANTSSKPVRECWLAVGRRGGKSFVLALIAVFLACFSNYAQYLAPGERGTVMIIAADKKQARVIFRYVRGLLHNVPMLKTLIQRETAEAFDLSNFVTIEISTASFKRTRGYTLVAALCDEIAFWQVDEESAEPDRAVLDALRPGMATIPNSMLLCASSPYGKRGAMWDTYSRHYGKDSDVLVWQAATRTMNPTVPQAFIDRAIEDDPASAASEYMAQFRNDLEAFVSRDVVQTAIIPSRYEIAPSAGTFYVGFADASGGSGGDSFTAGVVHIDRVTRRVVVDALREKLPPFSPENAITDLAAFFKSYRVSRITMDRWGGDFPSEQFRKHGISCEPSAKTKSDIYREFLPLLNSGRIELLDSSRLIKQLLGLERRIARGGRETIDHPPGGHDDIINAVAGASVLAAEKQPIIVSARAMERMRLPSQRAKAVFI